MTLEGWGYEGPDPSAGIFGEYYWHDACPVPGKSEDWEAELHENVGTFLGNGVNRYRMVTAWLTCRDCGGSSAPWSYREWDPEDDPIY